jgi:hypothetical protein
MIKMYDVHVYSLLIFLRLSARLSFTILTFLHSVVTVLERHSLDDANDPSVKWLKKIEGALVWEVRSLYLVAVGAPVFFIFPLGGQVIAGLGAVMILTMVRSLYHVASSQVALGFASLDPTLFPQDAAFSVGVTALFLRPIYKLLTEGGVAVRHSAGYKNMLKTKWMTLSGASLAVFSSTALYTNGLLFAVLGGYGKSFWTNPYLHILVFGLNLDSVLNDLGMLLVCGVLKPVSCASLGKHLFSTADPCEVKPETQPVFDSQAYEKDETTRVPPLSFGSSSEHRVAQARL